MKSSIQMCHEGELLLSCSLITNDEVERDKNGCQDRACTFETNSVHGNLHFSLPQIVSECICYYGNLYIFNAVTDSGER